MNDNDEDLHVEPKSDEQELIDFDNRERAKDVQEELAKWGW